MIAKITNNNYKCHREQHAAVETALPSTPFLQFPPTTHNTQGYYDTPEGRKNFVETHYNDFLRRLRYRFGSEGDDVCHSAALKFMNSSMTIQNADHANAVFWLKCREAARDLGLYAIATVSLDELAAIEEFVDYASDHIRMEYRAIALDLLRKLSRIHRLVVYLRFYKDYTIAETAQRLEMSADDVYACEQSAREILGRLYPRRSTLIISDAPLFNGTKEDTYE